MLLTVLEIVAFIAAAAIIGVALGWVLRGTLGHEQNEISEMRAQLRQLKKAQRESEAASKAEKSTIATTSVSASAVAEKAEDDKAADKASAVEKAPGKTPKKDPSSKSTRKPSSRKSLAEREADQEAGRQAFAEVIERLGEAETSDNLTKIYGIGKKYAAMLNELGIFSYGQISQLKKAEVRKLAAALGVLDDRLETEDWVGSSKKLLKESK